MVVKIATVHIDGGSRGNPGPAAYAVVLAIPDQPVFEECDTIGEATNNVAEYTALVHALERGLKMNVCQLSVLSDSELLVKQMNGEYRVKNADLQELYAEAKALQKQYQQVTFQHVRRELNKRADQLCNDALDGKPRPNGVPTVTAKAATAAAKTNAPKAPSTPVAAPKALVDDAIACLEAAAKTWASQGVAALPAQALWEQLWSIIEDANVLKKTKSK